MELKNNDAAVCDESISAQAGSADEIDLYDELTAFAALSPEEQLRFVARQEEKTTEATETAAVAEDAAEQPSPESFPVHAPIGFPRASQAVLVGATASNKDDSNATVESTESRSQPLEETKPIRLAAVEAFVPAAQSPFGALGLNAPAEEPAQVRAGPFEAPRASGPLGSLTLGYVFTGALSKGVCLACGAEAGTDDLFCITCGVFVDEIGSTLPAKPTCTECKQESAIDEIFCPWCGSLLSS